MDGYLPLAPASANVLDMSAHTNRLAREKSPYLLQHAYNPVDWWPWGDAAFAKAREESKPVFLSIGYSTCHWCHVMERESFEDPVVGAFLNRHFVSIKVDREERPDVDKIYMMFVQATSGAGGWPLNVFVTPDRKPFFGGTYFPPEFRHGRASFLQVLDQIRQVWQERREQVLASAEEIHNRLAAATASCTAGDTQLTPDTLRQACERFKAAYDPEHGGFGAAPKFPQPSIPLLLLRCAKRFGDDEALRMVLQTCDAMAAGGIHDHLGGGFARYSVDAQWLVPHFEKMLYDQAQLVQLYLDAFLVSGEARHGDVARDILDYVLRDLTHPQGGFFSAEDADSEGQEGKFYCWTRAELSNLLSAEEFNVAVRHFGITKEGNFVDHSHPHPLPGQNVLSLCNPVGAPTSDPPSDDQDLLTSAKAKMSAARNQRVRPHRDDKVLASWNGLMLGAFARAYAVLGEETYRTAAERNVSFLRQKLWETRAASIQAADHTTQTSSRQDAGKALFHRWRDGERDAVELLEGYAFLLDGVIALYEATLEAAHLEFAVELAEAMISKFYDAANGGFFQAPAQSTDLILRAKDDYDGAEPSGNSVATLALLKLAAITGRADLKSPAEATLRAFAQRMAETPQAVPYLLHALDFTLQSPHRVVITGDPRLAEVQALLRAVHSVYQPNKVVLGTAGPVEPLTHTLLTTNTPQVYLCTSTACQPPTGDAAQIRAALK